MKIMITCLLVLNMAALLAQETVLTAADQMPYFSGCEAYETNSEEKRKCSNLALVSFIAQSIDYPEVARQSGLEGTVYVGFVIDPSGKLREPKVLRDIGSGCGEAALAVLEQMPDWEPAHHAGEAVAVKLNLPIQFSMKDAEPNQSTTYKINWGLLIGSTVSQRDLLDNLDQKVVVRDPFGNDIPVSNLRFSYERKKKFYEAQSTGAINKDMKKLAKKAKSGGLFVLTATLQEDGRFLDVQKVYSIVD